MRKLGSVLLLAALGCGGSSVKVELFISDELVETPARSVRVLALSNTSCEALLSVPQEEAGNTGKIEVQHQARWPLDPEDDVWGELPAGVSLSILAAAYDFENLQIARGCETLQLGEDGTADLRIELYALPKCMTSPSALDLTIVLDTSTMMEVVDTELLHLDELMPRVIEGPAYPAGSRF